MKKPKGLSRIKVGETELAPIARGETTTLGDILDAVKELTKAIADLTKEQQGLTKQIELKVKAGRF